MRYFIITYYKKPNGQIDENTSVSRNLKARDIQTANIIMDFKKLEVVKAVVNSNAMPRDWQKLIDYYNQYYASTFERLLKENNWEIVKD